VSDELDFTGMPPEVEAAFERESNVWTDEEAREVWLDQLPFFAPTPEGVEAVRAAFADVVYRHAGLRDRDWGELHGLTALATADIPVLAIGGEQDRSAEPPAIRRIVATAQRGELVMLEGVGHFPFAEAPERYWGAVRDWLDRTG
jgi:pimeloyl-ACP methyl ester carboxylesterase